jgi:hypothetical protein
MQRRMCFPAKTKSNDYFYWYTVQYPGTSWAVSSLSIISIVVWTFFCSRAQDFLPAVPYRLFPFCRKKWVSECRPSPIVRWTHT